MDHDDSEALVSNGNSRKRRLGLVVVAMSGLLLFLVVVIALAAVSLNSEDRFDTQIFSKAAVASDSAVCSEHGKQMLAAGGSAADAAVATLLCLGVVHPVTSLRNRLVLKH